jgi:hypothetical protein
MTHTTFSALLALLEGDLTRDTRMAGRSSGGRVEPAVKIALTVRMLSESSSLDVIILFRVASSTVYDVFNSTVSSIPKRIAMPGCLGRTPNYSIKRKRSRRRASLRTIFSTDALRQSMEFASKFKSPRMSTDREDYTAAYECTPFLLRRVSTQNIAKRAGSRPDGIA